MHILRLVSYLRTKYLEILKEVNAEKFSDYYPNTDKKVELSSIHTLSIIPFFDGVYVSFPEYRFNLKLETLVKEFNTITKGSTIAFEKKKIEKE